MEFLKLFFRITFLSARRFFAEKRLLWAASLTYTTIFSLIPLLSVLFFVFNVFGSLAEIKTFIQPYIYKTLAPWAQEKVIGILNELVTNIDFQTIGFFSTSLLIISIFLLLFEIEYALNEIWLIKVKASALTRAALYWALLTIVPVLLALALFIFLTLQTYVPFKFIEVYISSHGVALLSYLVILSSFTVIYSLMPATPVSFQSALFGGLFASTLWKISGMAYNIYATKFFFYYPKIFGPLAAIPLFLLWIFLCWILFLFGAELVYIHQNRNFYSRYATMPVLQGNNRKHYLLVVFLFIAQRYHDHASPVSLKTLVPELNIPGSLAEELLEVLLSKKILVKSLNIKNSFVPGIPLAEFKLHDLLIAVTDAAQPYERMQLPLDDPLHASAQSLLSISQVDAKTKTVQDILPLTH